jgi:hypothetical protein
VSEGAISLLCCCGDESATAGYYVCEPQVCPEGYRRGWSTNPDFFVVRIEEAQLQFLLDNGWLDGYEWVWMGQYWQLGDFVEAANLAEVEQVLGGTVEQVNLFTDDISYVLYSGSICSPEAFVPPMPHHRVTGATIAASPTEFNSLVIFPPFCTDNFVVFHMLGSFVSWWGSDGIDKTSPENALPAGLRAKWEDSMGYRIGFYELVGVVPTLQEIRYYDYVPGTLDYQRIETAGEANNLIRYTRSTYLQATTLPNVPYPDDLQDPQSPTAFYNYPIAQTFGFRIIASERNFFEDYSAGTITDGMRCKGHHDGTAPSCFLVYPETAFFSLDGRAFGSTPFPETMPPCLAPGNPPCDSERFDYHLPFDPCLALSTGDISATSLGACCPDDIFPGLNYAHDPKAIPVPAGCEDVNAGYYYDCSTFGQGIKRGLPQPVWHITEVYSL